MDLQEDLSWLARVIVTPKDAVCLYAFFGLLY